MGIDLFSVFFYTFTFTVSIMLFSMADTTKKKKKIICSSIAILILCFVAGLRDNSIGRDIKVYVLDYFNAFHSAGSFSDALYFSRFTQLEPLYLLMLYVTSRFTGDLWLMLFTMQVFTVVPVYFGVLKWNKEYNISIGFAMSVYIFVFFNNSFNIMRQSMAAAFLFLGTTYLMFYNHKNVFDYLKVDRFKRKKELIIVIASYLCAFFLHKSALIGIAFVVLAWLLRKQPKALFPCTIIVILVIFTFLKVILGMLIGKIHFSPSIMYYINVFILQNEKTDWMLDHYTNALIFDMTFRTIAIAIPFFLIRKFNQSEHYVRVLTMLGYITYTLPWLTMRTIYGGRISMYSDFFLIILIPYLITKILRPKKNAILMTNCALWCYWFVWIIIVKSADANVYKFRF